MQATWHAGDRICRRHGMQGTRHAGDTACRRHGLHMHGSKAHLLLQDLELGAVCAGALLRAAVAAERVLASLVHKRSVLVRALAPVTIPIHIWLLLGEHLHMHALFFDAARMTSS
jgi:hypothetical protein